MTDTPVFNHLAETFAQAMQACPDPISETWYRVTGRVVRIRVVGNVLAERTTLPFFHLALPGPPEEPPHLSVDLWDGKVTGIPCPAGLAEDGDGGTRVVIGGVVTYAHDRRIVQYARRDAMTWLDRDGGHIIGWRASAELVPMFERAKPLPFVLSMWCHDRDMQVIHASLVGRPGRGVLFPGSNGAGKSTSALACLCAGFDFLGDDQVGLQHLADGSFLGHSLFCPTRMETDHLARFPLLVRHAIPSDDPDDSKPLVFLPRVLPRQLKPSVPVRVIALPKIVDATECRIRPAAKHEALFALAPSTLLQMAPSRGASGLEQLAQLVKHVPTYWLELGRDLQTVPARVDELLSLVER